MRKKRCANCIYWQRLNWAGGSARACHFLLETGQRRRKDDAGRCLSFTDKGRER